MTYIFHIIIFFSIYLILALSLNLIVGYCGLLSISHAVFFGVGAYTYALAALILGWGFVPALGLAIAVAAVVSLALSLASWRCRGDTFIFMSIAVHMAIFNLFQNWVQPGAELGTWKNLTNGPYGISGIPKPAIYGYVFESVGSIALLAIAGAVLVGGVLYLLCHSPWGRLLQSMRDDEVAAQGLGKNVRFLKVQAIAIACGLAGSAGGIYAAYLGFISPEIAAFDESVLMLSMVLVGGTGNIRGPVVGAAVLLILPEALRLMQVQPAVSGKLQLLIYGILLIAMMHIRPQGLAGKYPVT